MNMDGSEGSKYRGKCIIILIIDTGLFIFDTGRTLYFIILEFVTSATEAQRFHANQKLNTLYKHDMSNVNIPSPIAAITRIPSNNISHISSSSGGGGGSSIKNTKNLIKRVSSTIMTTMLNSSVSSDSEPSQQQQLAISSLVHNSSSSLSDLSSTSTSSVVRRLNHDYDQPSERDKLIVGYLCSIVIIIIQGWAVSTLWKAVQPETHARIGAKSCRKYCNYILFPRAPLVLFRWSVPAMIFALGETTVVCIFGISYCLVCYHLVSQLGKELIEITVNSSTTTAHTNLSSVATPASSWQNSAAFPNLIINPDRPDGIDTHPLTTILNNNINEQQQQQQQQEQQLRGLGDDDEELYVRPPLHEIPRHERIGYRV